MRGSLGGGGLHQVPLVAMQIFEDGHRSVLFCLGLPHKRDASGAVGIEVAPETIGVEEQENSSSRLVANAGDLMLVRCPGQEQAA